MISLVRIQGSLNDHEYHLYNNSQQTWNIETKQQATKGKQSVTISATIWAYQPPRQQYGEQPQQQQYDQLQYQEEQKYPQAPLIHCQNFNPPQDSSQNFQQTFKVEKSNSMTYGLAFWYR
jgi:hypothetical protein